MIRNRDRVEHNALSSVETTPHATGASTSVKTYTTILPMLLPATRLVKHNTENARCPIYCYLSPGECTVHPEVGGRAENTGHVDLPIVAPTC